MRRPTLGPGDTLVKRFACALAALFVVGGPAATVHAAPDPAPAAAPGEAGAQRPLTPQEEAQLRQLQQLDASLTRRTGSVTIPEAKVTLNLAQGYYFIGAADAKKVLTTGWGNPPDAVNGVLGMVFPAGKSPFEDTWGAVISFEKSGFVTDKDADDIKPGELLTQLRDGETEENRQREQAGFPATHLAGWAQPPSYDAAHHTLIWAKDITFTGQADHTLNYDLRMLGREGVLSVNIVATMADLPAVRRAGESLQSVVAYDPGARFTDYREGDNKAAYGVAGLLAAGLGLAAAKKIGLLGLLLAFGKKAFVLIAAGFAALVGWVKRLFGGGKKPASARPLDLSAEPAPAADPAAPDPALNAPGGGEAGGAEDPGSDRPAA